MAIEHRNNARKNTVMTKCPYCSEELPDGTGFSKHWPNCPANTNGIEIIKDETKSVSANECKAMQLLYGDGYTTRELMMVFEIASKSELQKHIHQECHHYE